MSNTCIRSFLLVLLVLACVPERATSEEFVYPLSAVVSSQGDTFIADRKLPGIWRVTAGGKRSVYFRAAKRYRTKLNAVRCLAADGNDRLLAGDSATRNVYRFDENGVPHPLTKLSDDDGIPENFGRIGIPIDIAVDPKGTVFVADLEVHRIWKLPARDGETNEPVVPEEFAAVSAPRGIAFDKQGRLWVVSHGKNQVLRLDADGTPEVIVSGRPFRFPNEITVTKDGVAYVADGYAKAVWEIRDGEEPRKVVSGAPLVNPVGITVAGDGLLIVDPRVPGLFRLRDGELSPFPGSDGE